MPFFFIFLVALNLRAHCIVLSIAFCFFKVVRFLSVYLLFCSTGRLVLSMAFPIGGIWLAEQLVGRGHSAANRAEIILVVVSMPLGGLLGGVMGFLAARALNRKLRWSHKKASPRVE